MYVCNFIVSPQGCKFFQKVLSFYTHYTFIGTTFINRCQPVSVRFSGPELVAPHLESTLDEQLQSWFARPISGATSVSCLTGETSVPGIEPETYSQSFGHHTKALALSFWNYCFRWVPNYQEPETTLRKNPLVLAGIRTRAVRLASPTLYPLGHCASLIFEY